MALHGRRMLRYRRRKRGRWPEGRRGSPRPWDLADRRACGEATRPRSNVTPGAGRVGGGEAARAACMASASYAPGCSPSPWWTPHEPPAGAARSLRAYTSPVAAGGSRLAPMPPAARCPRSCPPRPSPAAPPSPRFRLGTAAESPFPQGLHRDTIPIAVGPAVQFNPFYPAGPFPAPDAGSVRGPPDKSLFVRQQ